MSGAFPGAPQRRYTDYEVDLIAARYADVPLPNLYPADVPLPTLSSAEVGYFDARVGARRSAEVLYHHSFMGSHSTADQSEPLYSSNTMGKRPRLESSLTIYPQRLGEQPCAFYMKNRTCNFGEDCKFDHPQWALEEGGIPNWRKDQNVEDFYPKRPGEPDCPYFMKSGEYKFKSRCKFNHPKEQQSQVADSAVLPVMPSEPVCSVYEKTGKSGASCKFNHPKDVELRVPTFAGKQTIYTATIDSELYNGTSDGSIPEKTHTSPAPAEAHHKKGLPIRPGEIDCSFYMKTGSCIYGSLCRYNHPDRPVVDAATTAALAAPVVRGILPTPAPIAPAVVLHPVATSLPGFDIHATRMPVEPEPIIYPQRPGETVCGFYIKTGCCNYMDKCKFHHPIDPSTPRPNESWDPQQTVALSLAGLPRREGTKSIREIKIEMIEDELERFAMEDNETPQEMYDRLKILINKSRAYGCKKWTNHEVVKRMIRAFTVHNHTLCTLIRESPNFHTMTPDEVLAKIVNYDVMKKEAQHVKDVAKSSSLKKQDIVLKATKKSKGKEVHETSEDEENDDESSDMDEEELALFIRRFKRVIRKKKTNKNYEGKGKEKTKSRSKRACYNCREYGHFIANCPYERHDEDACKKKEDKPQDKEDIKKVFGAAHIGNEWDSNNESSSDDNEEVANIAINKSTIKKSLLPNESDWRSTKHTCLIAKEGKRKDAEVCAFYMRSGACKFGVHCKFDHPPPVETSSLFASSVVERRPPS